MDQIFERLEKLIQAWINSSVNAAPPTGRSRTQTHYRDPDLDAAMAELDDFLDPSKTETEKREEQQRRAQAERERRERDEQARRYRAQSGAHMSGEETSAAIAEAYRYLGLAPYAPFAEVKAAYKKLLFKYHPDRNSRSPEELKKATETSTRINAAYQIIETYEESKNSK